MSNKTPYELRFEVLQMARELVQHRYDLQNNAIELQLCTDIDRGSSVSKERLENLYKEVPSEEIIAKAKELYEFVLEK